MKPKRVKITDKMRLDWLEKNEVGINSMCGMYFIINRLIEPTPFDTYRQAIDAAIRKEAKNGLR